MTIEKTRKMAFASVKANTAVSAKRKYRKIENIVHLNSTLFDYHFRVTTRSLESEIKNLLAAPTITNDEQSHIGVWESRAKAKTEDDKWYVYAIQWFEHLVESYGLPDQTAHTQRYNFMYRLFNSFTLEQKAILQKGYNIHHKRSSPDLNLGFLHIELESNFPQESSIVFPVRVKQKVTLH